MQKHEANGRRGKKGTNNNYSLELLIQQQQQQQRQRQQQQQQQLLLTPGDNRLVRDEPILNTTPGH